MTIKIFYFNIKKKIKIKIILILSNPIFRCNKLNINIIFNENHYYNYMT